jgi:hypothetical protein
VKRRFTHVKRMTRPHKYASPRTEDASRCLGHSQTSDLKLRADEVYTTSLLRLSFYSSYLSSSQNHHIHHGEPGSQQRYVEQKLERMRTRSNNDAAQERLSQVADHMSGASKASGKKGKSSLLEKNPDDVSTLLFSLRDERTTSDESFPNLDAIIYWEHLTDYSQGRRYMCSPHTLHQGRKGRIQRHPIRRPPRRRFQSAPRAFKD